jgi:hypothetical protein
MYPIRFRYQRHLFERVVEISKSVLGQLSRSDTGGYGGGTRIGLEHFNIIKAQIRGLKRILLTDRVLCSEIIKALVSKRRRREGWPFIKVRVKRFHKTLAGCYATNIPSDVDLVHLSDFVQQFK